MAASELNRRYDRIEVRAQARVSSIDPERDPASGAPCFRESEELCANLSLGGAFIRTEDPPALGRRVLLQIELPGGTSVEAIGRVAWTQRPIGAHGDEPCGAGIEFVSDDAETRGVIARYLELRRERVGR